jgi:hypothetical protein
LKNVREVHLLEGFWNHNRIDQVVGRAVRARSHLALPKEMRKVEVFLYLSDFTEEQRGDRVIQRIDKGLTSDQYIHAVAMKKKNLSDQVLDLVRRASVDCEVHGSLSCFETPKAMSKDDQFRTLDFEDDVKDSQYAQRMTKLVPVEVNGVKFYLDKATDFLYDYDKLNNENILVRRSQL